MVSGLLVNAAKHFLHRELVDQVEKMVPDMSLLGKLEASAITCALTGSALLPGFALLMLGDSLHRLIANEPETETEFSDFAYVIADALDGDGLTEETKDTLVRLCKEVVLLVEDNVDIVDIIEKTLEASKEFFNVD